MFWSLQILVGSIVCVLVWYATRGLRLVGVKALVRAAPVALTLAPGIVVSGHGVFFPPGVALFIYALVSGKPVATADFMVYSFLVLWVIGFVCLLLKYAFDARYKPKIDSSESDHRSPQNTQLPTE